MENRTHYDLEKDFRTIEILQAASLSKELEGIKMENNILIGSKEWFQAINSGQIRKVSYEGTLTEIKTIGHNDYDVFTIVDKTGNSSTWPIEGNLKDYILGTWVRIDCAVQKYKTSSFVNSPTAEIVIAISFLNKENE